ncbi:MAG: extracellular solute-binding protein [Bacteroidales bacterium]|nr:extracellular solute-binding protein [Lachnoclostridium sp.]MCM1383802.1 extracellular solute-binding protein [Lachnoclostridium sp.]MCM1464430.1 extracellular solute-binding protein [Bacteroidales bacterium]
MKKMNKIVASLLAGSMVFSMAACGNNDASQGSSQASTPTSSAADGASDNASASAPAEIVKPDSIKVMWDGTVFKEGDNYAEVFYKALEEKLGMKIEWIRPDHSTYAEQVGIAFTDMDTIADVVILPATHYAAYAAQGNLWEMTDAWKNSETANSGRLTDVADQVIEGWYVNGPDGTKGIYGMYPARGNGCVTYVKAAWAKKAGYESEDKLPTDWAGYQQFLLDMKEANGKAPVLAAGGPIKANEAPYTNYLPEFWQDAYPGFYQKDDGTWVDGFSEKATADALDRIRWGMENGVMEASMLENPSTADVRNKFYDDTTGIFTYWAGTWAYTIKSNLAKKDIDDECWVLKPIKEMGAYLERLSPMIAITSSCKNPEGVFKYFIDPILDGGDVQMLWMYGVEGTHYEWNADGKTIVGLPTEASKGTEKEALTTKNLFEANLKLAEFSGVDPYVAADPVIDECFKIFNENSKAAPAINSSDIFASYDAELTKQKEQLCAAVAKGEMTGQEAIDKYNADCGTIVTAILDSFNNQ